MPLTSGAAAMLAQFGTNDGHLLRRWGDRSQFQPACRVVPWLAARHPPAEKAEPHTEWFLSVKRLPFSY
jgi:hypothetical protein